MDNSYYLVHIGALIGVAPLMWLWGWGMLSCYFPFLLSAKYYYVVKRPIFCKILISTQLNRSSEIKTRIEDRNKLPVIGLIYYITGTILLVAFFISDFCAIIKATMNESSIAIHLLACIVPYLVVGMALLCVLTFLLYRIDYGIGKYLSSGKEGKS